jgi:hypothetical protein
MQRNATLLPWASQRTGQPWLSIALNPVTVAVPAPFG